MRKRRKFRADGGRTRFGFVLLCTLTGAANAGELSHADGIEALRERMRRMDALVFERVLTPLEIDHERMRRADEIADLASELAAAATELATASRETLPDDARRKRFLDNARRLGAEAAELRRLAAERRLGEVSAQIDRLGHTCAACHADFRPAGDARP